MNKILIIKQKGKFFQAEKPNGEIIFGGEYNFGGVDGTKPIDVLLASINFANILKFPAIIDLEGN